MAARPRPRRVAASTRGEHVDDDDATVAEGSRPRRAARVYRGGAAAPQPSGPPTVLPVAVREPEDAQAALTRKAPRVDTSRTKLKRTTSSFRRGTGPRAAAPAEASYAEPAPAPAPPSEPDLDLSHARYEDVHELDAWTAPAPEAAHAEAVEPAPAEAVGHAGWDDVDDDDLLDASGLQKTRRNRILGSVAVLAAVVVALAFTI